MHIWYNNETDRARCMENFTYFIVQHNAFLTPTETKCIPCSGHGVIYDPEDPRDIIEGDKLRRTIKCPTCKGTKIGNISEWEKLWRSEKSEYKKRTAKSIEEKVRRKEILKKLNKEDISFLGLEHFDD